VSSDNETEEIKIWDKTSGKLIKTLETDLGIILSMELDGDTLLVGSEFGKVQIWELSTGTCHFTLDQHEEEVVAVGILEDNTVVSVSNDNTARLWKGTKM